jgi:hypothetical protein
MFSAKHMKSVMSLVIVGLLIFGMTGCFLKPPAKENDKDENVPEYYWIAGDPPEEIGVYQGDANSKDGFTSFVEIAGRYARKTGDKPGENHYMYFALQDEVYEGEASKLTIEITYLDKGTGRLDIQYANKEGTWVRVGGSQIGVVQLEDTNEWRTVRGTLTDVKLDRTFRTYDFRLTDEGIAPIYIHRIDIIEIVK